MRFKHFMIILGDLFYTQIVTRFFPRQKWLTDVIPRTFCDVDFLIEEVNFQCLIHYWEDDDGQEMLSYASSMYDNPSSFVEDGLSMDEIQAKKAEAKDMYHAIRAAYEWAKHRHTIYEQLTDELTKGYGTPQWVDISKSYVSKEQEFIDNDTKHLMVIIKYRKYLWS